MKRLTPLKLARLKKGLSQWDVSKLPDGFYDLRFVTSDGIHYYEFVVVGLKVARSRPGGGGGRRHCVDRVR